MMKNKELILKLIQKDLKHHQLTEGLRQLGLDDTGLHSLDMLPILGQLMGLGKGEITDRWNNIYTSFLNEAYKYPVSNIGEALYPVAEKCYEMLLACKAIDDRVDAVG